MTTSVEVFTRTATAKFLTVPPAIVMSVLPVTTMPTPLPEPVIV